MARKRDLEQEPDGPQGDAGVDRELEEGGDDSGAMTLLEEFAAADDAEVRVFRIANPDGSELQKPAYVTTLRGTGTTYSQLMDRLRDAHKGGTFRLDLRVDNRWRKKQVVVVEPPTLAVVATAAVQADTLAERMLTEFRRMREEDNARFEKLLADRRQPDVDPFAQVERITTIMKNLQPVSAVGGSTDVFGQVGAVLDLADKLAKRRGGDGGGSGESLLEKGLGLLAANLASRVDVTAGAAAAQPALPSPAAAGAAGDAGAGVDGAAAAVLPAGGSAVAHSTAFLTVVRQAMPELVRAAETEADPYVYAYLLLSRLPEDVPPAEILTWIADDDMVLTGLTTSFPQAAPHRAWFGQVVAEMRQMLQEGNNEE